MTKALAGILVFLLLRAVSVSGCACPPNSFYRLYNESDIVFLGQITSSTMLNADTKLITLKVIENFRDAKEGSKITIATPPDPSQCGISPEAALQILVFATARMDGYYHAEHCTHTNSFIYVHAFRKMMQSVNDHDTVHYDTEFEVTVRGRYRNGRPVGMWTYPLSDKLNVVTTYLEAGGKDSIVSVENGTQRSIRTRVLAKGKLMATATWLNGRPVTSALISGNKRITTTWYNEYYDVKEEDARRPGRPYVVRSYTPDGRLRSEDRFDGNGNLLKSSSAK